MYQQHTVARDSYHKNMEQKSNVVCTPVDNTLLRLCLLPLQDDEDTSKDTSSNNPAASSIFGSMDDGASSMSSVSYNTYMIQCLWLDM